MHASAEMFILKQSSFSLESVVCLFDCRYKARVEHGYEYISKGSCVSRGGGQHRIRKK